MGDSAMIKRWMHEGDKSSAGIEPAMMTLQAIAFPLGDEDTEKLRRELNPQPPGS